MTTATRDWTGAAVRPWADLTDRWLGLLGLTLAGYALFGKGFAYIGMPPLFIGEAVVASGVLCLLLLGRWRQTLNQSTIRWLIAFMIWGAAMTVPYLTTYGISALRDAVLWGYGALAVVMVGVILSRPERLGWLIRAYGRFVPWFLALIPFLWAIDQLFADQLPTWPWADVRVLHLKGGDVGVHLAGVLAFWAAGLAGRVPAWQILALIATICATGSSNRGGLLTFLLIACFCVALRPRSGALRSLAGVALVLLLLLAATNVAIPVAGKERSISAWQLVENVVSISADQGEMQGTKEWRLNWWSDIVDYTVFGDYFWTGKGFGVNLANDDGYQVNDDNSLRSPHSGHMSVLARMGVPGALLWIMLLGSWAWTMWRAYLLSRSRGDRQWSSVLLFLFAYGGACLIDASFDVYLEGPMGGIWFWSLVGTGLAAAWCYRHHPEVLATDAHEWAAPPGVSDPARPV